MKNLVKLFRLIALAAAIVFSLTAASYFGGDKIDSEEASDSIRTGSESGGNTGAEVTVSSTASGVSGSTVSSALVGKWYT